MIEESPRPAKRHYSESPYLTFAGSDLALTGDPATEPAFALTFNVLENLTNYLAEFDLWPELEPQTVKDELAHFNAWYAHDHPAFDGEAVTLPALHALSLRRILAAGETRGARAADYEVFVVLHAAIFRALQEEREIERLMEGSSCNSTFMSSSGSNFA